eukprot:14243302-Alexandrium_andersonii.AAC.1
MARGRFAAWLGRSTAVIAHPGALRLAIYVDDPLRVAGGSLGAWAREFAAAHLWAVTVGDPLAWREATLGSSVAWIGARLELLPDSARVAIPEQKADDVLAHLADFARSGVLYIKRARSSAGELSYVAGLAPTLWPRAGSLWRI